MQSFTFAMLTSEHNPNHIYAGNSLACLLQNGFDSLSLCKTFIFAALTYPKSCLLHISFRYVPMQDIHIYSLGYEYWQFFMSLTVIIVVHCPLLFSEDVLHGVTMFGPSLLLTLVKPVTAKEQKCV